VHAWKGCTQTHMLTPLLCFKQHHKFCRMCACAMPVPAAPAQTTASCSVVLCRAVYKAMYGLDFGSARVDLQRKSKFTINLKTWKALNDDLIKQRVRLCSICALSTTLGTQQCHFVLCCRH
jgi:hypothetical protein